MKKNIGALALLVSLVLVGSCGGSPAATTTSTTPAVTSHTTPLTTSTPPASNTSTPTPSSTKPATSTTSQPPAATPSTTTTKPPTTTSQPPTTPATTPPVTTPAGNPYQVTVQGFSFVPPNLTVPVGSTVTWLNLDSTDHTATSSAQKPVFDLPLPASGGKASFTFTQAGKYPYICSIHPEMTGQITVQ